MLKWDEQLVQISCRVGEGETKSFNIDLLDPSKVPQHVMPRSLHEVMPLKLQKGIGPSDLLPSAGLLACARYSVMLASG